MTIKSNNRDFVEVGTFVSISSPGICLTIYITDFKPDLEGVTGADLVAFYNESDAKELIGKVVGSTFIEDDNKYEIFSIVKKYVNVRSNYPGSIELLDNNTSFTYYGDNKVLRSLEGIPISNLTVSYFISVNPGSIVKNRSKLKKMRKKISDTDELFEFLSNKHLNEMTIVFSNGIRLESDGLMYVISLNSILERNLIINKLIQSLKIKIFDVNTLKHNTAYRLNKSGVPEEIIFNHDIDDDEELKVLGEPFDDKEIEVLDKSFDDNCPNIPSIFPYDNGVPF